MEGANGYLFIHQQGKVSMNREEFLLELRKNLNGLPKDEIENRIEFYSEMISDRVEEGLTEEEAINDIGGVEGVIKDIAKEIPLTKLVKEKIKPKRSLYIWEIVLIFLGFPIWFPILLTITILAFVMYFILWILDLVFTIVGTSLFASGLMSLLIFFIVLFKGDLSLDYIGYTFVLLGVSLFMFVGVYYFTKLAAFVTKKTLIEIKSWFIRGKK